MVRVKEYKKLKIFGYSVMIGGFAVLFATVGSWIGLGVGICMVVGGFFTGLFSSDMDDVPPQWRW